MQDSVGLRILITSEDYFRSKQRYNSSSPHSSDDDNDSEDRTVPFTLSPLDKYRGSRKPVRLIEEKKKYATATAKKN